MMPLTAAAGLLKSLEAVLKGGESLLSAGKIARLQRLTERTEIRRGLAAGRQLPGAVLLVLLNR